MLKAKILSNLLLSNFWQLVRNSVTSRVMNEWKMVDEGSKEAVLGTIGFD